MHFDVFAQRRRVRVGLVAAVNATIERLVGRVNVGVLLPVGTVGETTVTAGELTHERLLAYTRQRETVFIPIIRRGSQLAANDSRRSWTPS